MSVEGFADLLVRSTLLLALVGLLAAAVRRGGGSAAMRHVVWLLGLLGLGLLPLLSALLPSLPVLPQISAVSAPAAVPASAVLSGPAGPAEAPQVFDRAGLLWPAYFAVAAGLVGRLALGRFLLARLWKRARPLRDDRWTGLLAELSESLGSRRRVALRMADGPAMPMTWASVRPRILLPLEALGWTEERRRVVLLHELAHVARHDSLSRMAATIVCAFYWFHPGAWYAARQMRLEQEHACDDLVLAQGARASLYARNLLDAARAYRTPGVVASLSIAMVRTSELERRLTAIVRHAPRGRADMRLAAGFAAVTLAATSLIAVVAPVAARDPGLPPAAARAAPDRIDRVPPAASVSIARARLAVPAVTAAPDPVSASALAAVSPPTPTPPLPAVPALEALPAIPAVEAVEPLPEDDYDGALAQHRRDSAAYRVALDRYRRELRAHRDQVRALRAEDNLGHSGNAGNPGNPGNLGMRPIPAQGGLPAHRAILPTPPTMPTPPTPPTPLRATARQQGP